MRNVVVSILVVLVLTAICSAGLYGGGTGDPNAPFLISLPEHLVDLSDAPADWGDYFLMTNDIDFSEPNESNFSPIGNHAAPFSGCFDGDNHTLFGFNYKSSGTDYIGLFGLVRGEGATITSLNIADCHVDAGMGDKVGALVGRAYEAVVVNCSSSGIVISSGRYVGGLIGQNYWTSITQNCSSSVNVYGGSKEVGGLIGGGTLGSKIINCHATGDLHGDDWVGGLVGLHDSQIRHSYATGNVELQIDSTGEGGGLAGASLWRSILASYATGNVVGGRTAGGLVGYTYDINIRYCYALGDVTSIVAGGLVGYNGSSQIQNCYAMGEVFGSQDAGGLMGRQSSDSWTRYCYATGKVDGGYTGGLFGNRTSSPTCLWDKETTEQYREGYDYGSFGNTTQQMQQLSTYLAKDWDFTNENTSGAADIWRLCEDGFGYPRLAWEFGSDYSCPDGVSIEDLLYLSSRWLESRIGLNQYISADRTGDGKVTIEDYSLLAEQWMSGI